VARPGAAFTLCRPSLHFRSNRLGHRVALHPAHHPQGHTWPPRRLLPRSLWRRHHRRRLDRRLHRHVRHALPSMYFCNTVLMYNTTTGSAPLLSCISKPPPHSLSLSPSRRRILLCPPPPRLHPPDLSQMGGDASAAMEMQLHLVRDVAPKKLMVSGVAAAVIVQAVTLLPRCAPVCSCRRGLPTARCSNLQQGTSESAARHRT
jgi:hypothetical protein